MDSVNGDDVAVKITGRQLNIPATNHKFQAGQSVVVVARPEMMSIDTGEAHATGIIAQAAYLGNHIEYVVDIQGQKLAIMESDPRRMTVHPEGTEVGLRFIEGCLYVLPKK